jgi:hypothetical protein
MTPLLPPQSSLLMACGTTCAHHGAKRPAGPPFAWTLPNKYQASMLAVQVRRSPVLAALCLGSMRWKLTVTAQHSCEHTPMRATWRTCHSGRVSSRLLRYRRGYLSLGTMGQCVVHALKGLTCCARVTPASSPASPSLPARGCASPFSRTQRSQKT